MKHRASPLPLLLLLELTLPLLLPLVSLALALLVSPKSGAETWSWDGDLRLRSQLEKHVTDQSRWGLKLRVRLGAKVQISSDLKAEVRLASAKGSRSTNQTLGDSKEPGFRRRFIGLDLAYAQWTPVESVHLWVGRLPQVHYRPGGSQVVLDDDISLEGAAMDGKLDLNPNVSAFGNAGSTYIREIYDNYYSEDGTDIMINWAQVGLKWRFGDTRNTSVTAGYGFFNFVGVQGKNFSDLVTGGVPGQNSENPPGVVQYPFLPRQLFIEVATKISDLEYGAFFEQVVNHETPGSNRAWWTGLNLTHKIWDGQLAYTKVESDAVLSPFTNSDFANGETNTEGIMAAGRWKFAKNMAIRMTHFHSHVSRHSLNEGIYWRNHLDLSVQF